MKGHNGDDQSQAVAVKFPYAANFLKDTKQFLTDDIIKKVVNGEEHIQIGEQNMITISKKRLNRQLHEVLVAQYRNKETGQIIERIEQSTIVTKCYEYLRMGDFRLQPCPQSSASIQQLNNLLKNKIIHGNTLHNYEFFVFPETFMRPFNLSLPTTDLLNNRSQRKKEDNIKSQSISFGERIPQPPNLPKQKSELLETLRGYFERRPCWLRNTLEFHLRNRFGEKKYTLTELKNALKYLGYTYKDGPWKHSFCRFGFDPTQDRSAVIYQVLLVKLKEKSLEDYEQSGENEQEEGMNILYDPTFKDIPAKFLRLYQLCDIEQKRVYDLVRGAEISAQQCTKQYGWFTKREYLELHRITKQIRNQKLSPA